jgi:DNA-directed RNA polymerase sigma subunit (sigma70/sigma32)
MYRGGRVSPERVVYPEVMRSRHGKRLTFRALLLECGTMENETDNKSQPMEPQHLVSMPDDKKLPVVGHTGLQRYLQEISQFPLLSREETEELAVRYHETGDPEAAYKLVSSNLRLVVKVAMDFQKYWMQNFLDLIQEGNVGLVQAAKKFDPFREVKFSYYGQLAHGENRHHPGPEKAVFQSE